MFHYVNSWTDDLRDIFQPKQWNYSVTTSQKDKHIIINNNINIIVPIHRSTVYTLTLPGVRN